ncbi:unnamed protein product [Lathyrus sativus]|nr:unnamed protein product [Lathyrus sativus]
MFQPIHSLHTFLSPTVCHNLVSKCDKPPSLLLPSLVLLHCRLCLRCDLLNGVKVVESDTCNSRLTLLSSKLSMLPTMLVLRLPSNQNPALKNGKTKSTYYSI